MLIILLTVLKICPFKLCMSTIEKFSHLATT